MPLHVSLRAEALLGQRDRGLLALWQNSPLRHIWTDSLPRFLGLLQHASLLGQQELRSEFIQMKLTSDVNLMTAHDLFCWKKEIKTKGAPFPGPHSPFDQNFLCLVNIENIHTYSL